MLNFTYINYKSGCPHQAESQWGNHTELLFHLHYCWELKNKTAHSHHYYLHNHQQELWRCKNTKSDCIRIIMSTYIQQKYHNYYMLVISR